MRLVFIVIIPLIISFIAHQVGKGTEYFDAIKTGIGFFIGSMLSFFYSTLHSAFQESYEREREYRNNLASIEVIHLDNLKKLKQSLMMFNGFKDSISNRSLMDLNIIELNTNINAAVGILNIELKRSVLNALSVLEDTQTNLRQIRLFYEKFLPSMKEAIFKDDQALYMELFNDLGQKLSPLISYVTICFPDAIQRSLDSLSYVQQEALNIKPSWKDKYIFGYENKAYDFVLTQEEMSYRVKELREKLKI
ncbi:hypothetical protein [Leptospira neocaledonica]|uniref:Uncharacterized protein n=1 Tax=Leptospira neocaledonica TaxID=2023192 RepID=A0A2M9ZTL7_9LEPT|nr:hypothetical protein [Leptospira neocaledonica]PJZ75321.1 hypothetical protein CH365_19570 [Leptospira neocaledonica]